MRSTELERRSREATLARIASIINACAAPQLDAPKTHATSAATPEMSRKDGQNGAYVHLQAASCNTVRCPHPLLTVLRCRAFCSSCKSGGAIPACMLGSSLACHLNQVAQASAYAKGLLGEWSPEQDDAAAAGLRALEKRISSVPNAAQDFLQAWAWHAAPSLLTLPAVGTAQKTLQTLTQG